MKHVQKPEMLTPGLASTYSGWQKLCPLNFTKVPSCGCFLRYVASHQTAVPLSISAELIDKNGCMGTNPERKTICSRSGRPGRNKTHWTKTYCRGEMFGLNEKRVVGRAHRATSRMRKQSPQSVGGATREEPQRR